MDIPNELVLIVSSFLNTKDLLEFSSVSFMYRKIITKYMIFPSDDINSFFKNGGFDSINVINNDKIRLLPYLYNNVNLYNVTEIILYKKSFDMKCFNECVKSGNLLALDSLKLQYCSLDRFDMLLNLIKEGDLLTLKKLDLSGTNFYLKTMEKVDVFAINETRKVNKFDCFLGVMRGFITVSEQKKEEKKDQKKENYITILEAISSGGLQNITELIFRDTGLDIQSIEDIDKAIHKGKMKNIEIVDISSRIYYHTIIDIPKQENLDLYSFIVPDTDEFFGIA